MALDIKCVCLCVWCVCVCVWYVCVCDMSVCSVCVCVCVSVGVSVKKSTGERRVQEFSNCGCSAPRPIPRGLLPDSDLTKSVSARFVSCALGGCTHFPVRKGSGG